MLVPSIDLQGGNAVQLVGGKELELDAGDPRPLADRFGRCGEIAVVDLDAALGRGDNTDVIVDLLSRAPCRVGGGIRSVEAAKRWLELGATKVVLGTAARPAILRELPRERVVAALDAVDGEVVVEGWQTRTGASILERMAELRDYVGGFLVTFVEREGRLGGTDLGRVAALVEAAGDARVTIAGGVTTAAEIAELHRLGADAQVGMALYTGRLGLGEAFAAPLRSDRADGLFPTVVTDERGIALGLAYSSAESIEAALVSGRGTYWSRKRGLWEKGKTSGHIQELVRIELDCDTDTLKFTVRQRGAFCHTGTRTCFGADGGIAALERTIRSRAETADAGSYTRKLLDDDVLLGSKLREEADELATASTAEEVAWEAADVLYFTLVKMRAAGVSLADVERMLDTRRGKRRKGRGPSVQSIVDDVRNRGWDAVEDYGSRFGDGEARVYGRAELEAACEGVDVALLERTAARIRTFAEAQLAGLQAVDIEVPGGRAGLRYQPVERAGCYAPGGRFPLPSTVLMTAVTARVAGVEEVIVVSPKPSVVTLAAAYVAGADKLVAIGGAQAVAAMATGCGPVPRCDVIVGPGNRFVTEAKRLVSGEVRIDMLAGPSELVVLADDHADAGLVVADLLAQAEHDPDAIPSLITTSEALLEAVRGELEVQLSDLPTAPIAREALKNGVFEVVGTVEEGVARCDALAPEHLALHLEDTSSAMERLRHYGAVFVGAGAAEVLGDYGAGPNHVLPTGGTARSEGGLSVLTFLRNQSWLRADAPAELARDSAQLARLEGLEAHARAADRRT